MSVFGAADPVVLVPAGGAVATAMAAMFATVRYMKRTEDDIVDGLREELARLKVRVDACDAETSRAAVERYLTHRQIVWLMRTLREAEVIMPDGFPTV